MSYIFISYVKEDAVQVDRLIGELRSAGMTVWIDREDLLPGQRWREAIRQAICNGMFFMACFSANYSGRGSTYMNEELTLAVEQLRKMPSNRAWFIPVLLSDCSVPEREIGGGERLSDIQWVSLFNDWRSGVAKILRVVGPQLLGVKSRKKEHDEHGERTSAVLAEKAPLKQFYLEAGQKGILSPTSYPGSQVGSMENTYKLLLMRCLKELSPEACASAVSELQEGIAEREVFKQQWMEPRLHFIVRALVEAANELDSVQKSKILVMFQEL